MAEENDNVEVVETDKTTAGSEQPKPQDEKKYTDTDVDAIIDKKFAKWKADQEAKESEAKKLAKMNADDKQAYQLKKREQELADREAEINKRELTAEAKSILSERDLPIELVNNVNLTDADSVHESIDQLQKSWEEAVQKGVSERIKGGKAIKKAPGAPAEITKEQFDKMGYKSRNELFARNLELYNKLKG